MLPARSAEVAAAAGRDGDGPGVWPQAPGSPAIHAMELSKRYRDLSLIHI